MGPVRSLREVLVRHTDVSPDDVAVVARAFILQLRAMGYGVLPLRASRAMTKAANAAMRNTGFLAGTPHQALHEKHAIRYAAMVDAFEKDFLQDLSRAEEVA